MDQIPYRVLVQDALDQKEDALACRLTTIAMQEVADELQPQLQGWYYMDLPFIVAALEMAVESIRASMPPAEQQFIEKLKTMVVCTTITLSRKEALELGDADR